MNLNDKLKQERTGLTASQYSDLQELFVDRYVDGMSTKDLVEYVYNDMMQYVDNQPEQEFLDDCKDYWDDHYDEIIQEIKGETLTLLMMTLSSSTTQEEKSNVSQIYPH